MNCEKMEQTRKDTLESEADNLDEVEMEESNDEDECSLSTGCNSPKRRDGPTNEDDRDHLSKSPIEQRSKKNRDHATYRDYDDDASDNRLERHEKKSPIVSSLTREQISPARIEKTNIIHTTNISPVVTLEQMQTFFGFLGEIIDLAMYHFEEPQVTNFKVCFVEFSQRSSVLMAQHLTNTIFIDRAIFVLPYNHSKIPASKELAKEMGYADTEYVSNINSEVSTQIATGANGSQVLVTTDPRLTLASLQQYPQLPINTDPTRIEEIRRTLYIGNLDSSQNPDQVLKFFNDIGEVKYIRVAGDETQPTRFAFVEFTHQASVANALLYNGYVFGSRALKINHSNNPIVKPQPKLEIEDPSKKHLDSRSAKKEASSRDRRHSRNDRKKDRRGFYDRRVSPRDQRSRRSRSREIYSRPKRSRSRDHSARRSRSRDDLSRRRSRSKESSRRRRSRSKSSDRRSKHKSSSRRR